MKRSGLHIDDLRSLIAKGLAHGATRHSVMEFRWDISRDCENSHTTEFYSRPDGYRRPKHKAAWIPGWEAAWGEWFDPVRLPDRQPNYVTVGPGMEHSLVLLLDTRCRKCLKCRKARAALWRLRAETEIRSAPRTWFATYTLRPEEAERSLWVARDRMAKNGVDYDALNVDRQFVERTFTIQPSITKMIKRLRKTYTGAIRYCIVAEAHRSGVPHFHGLIHQIDPDLPLVKRALREQWWLGFSAFKLVENTASARYLCKYLTKSSAARVRASQNYGKHNDLDHTFLETRKGETKDPTMTNSVAVWPDIPADLNNGGRRVAGYSGRSVIV